MQLEEGNNVLGNEAVHGLMLLALELLSLSVGCVRSWQRYPLEKVEVDSKIYRQMIDIMLGGIDGAINLLGDKFMINAINNKRRIYLKPSLPPLVRVLAFDFNNTESSPTSSSYGR